MPDHTFKTYIFKGHEYYEYDADTGLDSEENLDLVRKEVLFPESLLSLLYLDASEYEPLFAGIAASLRELRRSKDTCFVDQAIGQLNQLACVHIYFAPLCLDWRQRLWNVQRHGFAGRQKLISPNEIAAIPAELSLMRRQIMDLFRNVLDIDGADLPVAERMARYYGQTGKAGPVVPFRFEARPIRIQARQPGCLHGSVAASKHSGPR